MNIKKSYIVLGIVGVLALILLGGGCSTYNSLVKYDEKVNEAWSNIETYTQRRLDLIPNLVNTVKGYAAHESNTLQAVTDARVGLKRAYDNAEASLKKSDPNSPESMTNYMESQSELNRQMGLYINAVHEAYPDLKANQNFLDLQVQLEGTENRIATARSEYNKVVREYNTKRRIFPNNIFAGICGFKERKAFEAEAAAAKAPVVDFGTGAQSVDF